jgi:hypothetical protein
MNSRSIVAGWIVLTTLALTLSSSRQDALPERTLVPGEDYIQGEVVVTFAPAYAPTPSSFSPSPPSSGSSPIDSIFEYYEAVELRKLVSTFDTFTSTEGQQLERTYLFRYQAEVDAQDMAEELSQLPYFESVELNLVLHLESHGTQRFVPGDTTRFSDQWYFDNSDSGDVSDIDLPEAWVIEPGGDSNLVIGIFDEGTMIDTNTANYGWRLHSDFNFHWVATEDSASPGVLNGADLDGRDNNGDAEGSPPHSYAYEANIIGFNLLQGYDGDESAEAEYNKRFWYGVPHCWLLCPGPPIECDYPSWEVVSWNPHGVWVGSIAAAKLDGIKHPNGPGDYSDIVGVAYRCQVYNARFSQQQGSYDMAQAIIHLAKKARVVNMSFGSAVPSQSVRNAVNLATQYYDCVLVASTGNRFNPAAPYRVDYPAKYDSVLAVGALKRTPIILASYSSYDTTARHVDVVAPVGDFPSNTPVADSFGNCLDSDSECSPIEVTEPIGEFGTSFAAPQASGLAALIRSRFPTMKQYGVKQRIKASAQFYWANTESNRRKYGSGKINAYRALTEWGPITESVTWDPDDPRDGTFYISGDITIEDGGSLTIEAGSVVKVAPDHEEAGADTARVEILVKDGGTLNIEGTGGDPVVFESFTDSSPTNNDWVGIQFESGSTGSLEHLVIRNAETAITNFSDDVEIDYARIEDCEWGIEVWEDILVEHSVITDCEDYGIYVKDGTATLSSDTISYCGVSGVDMAPWSQGASGLAVISSSYIHHNDDYGVHLSGSSDSLYVSGSTIRDNEHGVAVATGARAHISGSTLSSNTQNGLLAYSTSGVTVSDCDVDSNGTNGIYCLTSSNIVIKGDSLERNVIGIYCNDESSPTIGAVASGGQNYIKYNNAGIKCEDESSPEIAWNQISYNGDGVCALDDAEPSLGNCDDECPEESSCGGNSIHDNTGYHVSNLSQGVTILAECNYWGPRGPQANKFSGSVDYSPDRGTSDPVPAPGVESDSERATSKLPERFAMGRNVPNPFNPTTTIHYEVPNGGGDLSIVVYDVQGKVVKRLYGGHQVAGYHRVEWDGKNEAGVDAATGVYFVQMRAKAFVETQKVVLIK